MNAVEIEEAVSALAREPFDPDEFPFAFLAAFGNKETTIRKLRAGASNRSDVGGILQRNHIHLAVAEPGKTVETLARLRASPQTERQRAKFILATDGEQVEAEELGSGEVRSFPLEELGDNFSFFLPLAGISTVREVKNNPIDIKATARLNRLYVQLLKENPDWGSAAKRADLNRFMARLIFCFFAEDTGIFHSDDLFTATVQQMSAADGSNTHEVIGELFRAMNLDPRRKGERAGVRPWADVFPYVNGGLFEDEIGCPRFSRTSRAYLLRAGELDWRTINPDIFGSMIQAVADEDERGELGMHYTSVPNIRKVLDPLFLDDLAEQLEAAGTNKRKLYNLRSRLSRIRVFDPACGSGNFLVIAYMRMREIEDEIMRRRGEALERSAIRLTQFYGIEIKSFATEIARLSLLIAEFQCDVRFIGQAEARALVLPLHATGNIVTGNALRLDWEEVCPPAKTSVEEHDLGGPTGRLALDGGEEQCETYVCGNPPYLGYNKQSSEQKDELRAIFEDHTKNWKSLDYISGWFGKMAEYATVYSAAAFVSTNSLCQGEHAAILWPVIFDAGLRIFFAVPNFRWSNNAARNATVTVSVIGLTGDKFRQAYLYLDGTRKACHQINEYLIDAPIVRLTPEGRSISGLPKMILGNMPKDGGNLILSREEVDDLLENHPEAERYIEEFLGSQEFVNGSVRYCLWIEDNQVQDAAKIPEIRRRLDAVAEMRRASPALSTIAFADRPHRFKQIQGRGKQLAIIVPSVSSETRRYLPVGLLKGSSIISSLAFALYDAPLFNLAIIGSQMHLAWVATVCGKLETRYRYSNTIGWHPFPVPKLTEQNKADLTRCAEDILLAREAHFPATIAELYDPDKMPADLRAAHDRNDETLERIYIGRRFRNDTERLEKLFDLYTKMTAKKETA